MCVCVWQFPLPHLTSPTLMLMAFPSPLCLSLFYPSSMADPPPPPVTFLSFLMTVSFSSLPPTLHCISVVLLPSFGNSSPPLASSLLAFPLLPSLLTFPLLTLSSPSLSSHLLSPYFRSPTLSPHFPSPHMRIFIIFCPFYCHCIPYSIFFILVHWFLFLFFLLLYFFPLFNSFLSTIYYFKLQLKSNQLSFFCVCMYGHHVHMCRCMPIPMCTYVSMYVNPHMHMCVSFFSPLT